MEQDPDPTTPDREPSDDDTQPLVASEDAGHPRAEAARANVPRWLLGVFALAAVALGCVVGATIALAGGGSPAPKLLTSTSVQAPASTTSTPVTAGAPSGTRPPDSEPPTTVVSTVPATSPATSPTTTTPTTPPTTSPTRTTAEAPPVTTTSP